MDRFSHIYIEEKAFKYAISQNILDRFGKAKKIEIGHYKDVFCRPNQGFQVQKSAQKLILAVKKDNFLYKGPEVCQNFGNENFYYTSSILNCIYNCDYCYLQGMYPSANIVVFVNIEDFFSAVADELRKHPVYLTVSYDTDLLAFENVIPFSSLWIDFARKNSGLKIEIRTKSANYASISHLEPAENIILAWTLSPERVIQKYEKLTPSLQTRLLTARQAVIDGWKVRLVFDPIIRVDHWQEVYGEFIQTVFSSLPAEMICDAGLGAFRMAGDYLKRIKKSRVDSDLIHYPFECRNGVAGYPVELEKELVAFVYQLVTEHMEKRKVYL